MASKSRFGELRKVAKTLKAGGYTKKPHYLGSGAQSRQIERMKAGDHTIQRTYAHPSGKSVYVNVDSPKTGGKLSWGSSTAVKRKGTIYGVSQQGDFSTSGTVTSSRSTGGGRGLVSLRKKLKLKSGQDSAHLGQHGRPGGHAGYGR